MKSLSDPKPRDTLLKIFSESLKTVKGRLCVATFLSRHPLPTRKVRVIAIGKAAASMLRGVLDEHAEHIEAGLIITKAGHTEIFAASSAPIEQLLGAHPYPDQRSIDAGTRLLEFINTTPVDCGFLFLLSGGASALVEVLPPNVSVEQLHELNYWLLAQGWPIEKMNRIRKSVSMIKAGRLAQLVAQHRVMQLVISDVPNDDLSVIGSGLLVPSVSKQIQENELPDWLLGMQSQVPPPPRKDDPCFAQIQSHIIATNSNLRKEAARITQELGYTVCGNAPIVGDAAEQGRMVARAVRDGPPGIWIWGGETVVTLPSQPGQGGRCQHLALAAATELAGHHDVIMLAVGSDGNDGPGDVAGALVDGQTLTRAREAGAPDAVSALAAADAGSFLDASGDLVDTGPTGTNVMDLILGLKLSAE